MRRRIVIVTNGPLCRNPRVGKEAATLGGVGHDVTVLGVRNHAPSVALDAELLRNAPFRCEMIDALTPGWPRFRRRLVSWMARKAVNRTGWQTPRALGPFFELLRRARTFSADLTIVHNEVAHCVGARLLDEGRCVAADIEDWHSEDLLADARRYRPLGLIRRTEEKLLQGCIYTTTTSHALADGLHARYRGRRPEVITNSFPLQPNPRTTPPNDPPVFFWFSQTVGPGRGLEPFLDAWCRMNQRTRVVLLGEANDYREQLLARLPAERRSFVQFFPFVPPSALPTTIADQDVGLALEPSSPANKDLTISNKILQYLNAGLAVVATGTLGQREVLARAPKAGLVVDATHADAFAAMLDGFVADRQFLRERQAAARRLAEDVYCWEREAPRLLALVDTALRTDASN